jgi:hypothetical protein
MAYASALGKLQVEEGVGQLLALLKKTQNEGARMELALSLARLVGDEAHFIRLAREARADTGTATSQAVTALRKIIGKAGLDSDEHLAVIDDCADKLAREELEQGVVLLGRLIQLLPEKFNETCVVILQECAACLAEYQATRLEYILLALHIIHVGWQT